jgi:dTDP-4-dehydrorhamnose 3,5-epimerase
MIGVSLCESPQYHDSRGSFTKILTFAEISSLPQFELREVFRTFSTAGTIRGMHLQLGIAENWRLIQVVSGSVFDILIDLRRHEPTYGQVKTYSLSALKPQTLIVPPGVAHGFQALTDAEILYLTSHQYNASLDTGVNPFSIGIKWPLEVTNISERDIALVPFSEFKA